MLFNSIEFAFFLPIVFLLYWFVFDYALRRCKHQLMLQNLFIVVASYIFYGWWNWRFLILIAITTLCSYLIGLLIEYGFIANKCEEASALGGDKPSRIIKRLLTNPRLWLWVNVLLNLAILGTYKYYDFFVLSFAQMFGCQADNLLLHLVLPVGISFYTFQALSYSIDVYRRQILPTHDLVAFTAFLSFFPQLVAGPIERATNLLPQFLQKRHFDYTQAVDGMRQILWGLFKKIVVADNCATYVDTMFADYASYSGSTLLLAAVLFSVQIYGDFSGYSDIAIGTAKLFGIKLMRNFNVPYFSRDIAEFWRRWHISLTTWFRDYVYIPLGGSRPVVPERIHHKEAYKKAVIIRNTFIIFLLSGFWHGANWTFIAWGAYHAFLFLPLILLGKNRRYRDTVATITLPDGTTKSKMLPSFHEAAQMLFTFTLAVFGWIIFRADTITDAGAFLMGICNKSLISIPWLINRHFYIPLACAIVCMFLVEWVGRLDTGSFLSGKIRYKSIRWIVYLLLIAAIARYGGFEQVQFIYFQF
mgnify:FL=1